MITADIAHARSKPIPASVDTKGYYSQLLDHLTAALGAAEIGGIQGNVTAYTELTAMGPVKLNLLDEINAAVPDSGVSLSTPYIDGP